MKSKLFTKANLYLFAVILGILLILFKVYNLVDSDKATATPLWKEWVILFIWIIFTAINFIFYKTELKKLDKNNS